jgi:hypothetical protein
MDEQLIVSSPDLVLRGVEEFAVDGLAVGSERFLRAKDGIWSPFHALDTQRQALAKEFTLTLGGALAFAVADDESGLDSLTSLHAATLKFSRSNGAPYAALYDNGQRLASLMPGGYWLRPPFDGQASGMRLYVLSPAYGRMPIAPCGPRSRPSSLAECVR